VKFSAQEEYGLRCLIQIAQKGPDGSVTIPEVSKTEGLSATHVAKLLAILRKDGFITSTRGQTGGYTLAKPASAILVSDVLASLGGKLYDADFCARHSGNQNICAHDVDCTVRSLWSTIQSAVDLALRGLTLQDMLAQGSKLSNVTLYTATRSSQT
jgi:Rrf2 family protein